MTKPKPKPTTAPVKKASGTKPNTTKAVKPIAAPVKKATTKATVSVEQGGPKPAPSLAATNAGFRLSLLDNWGALNSEISTMAEDECAALINAERAGQCRPSVILRLHGRYNKLRGSREKSEFMRPLGE